MWAIPSGRVVTSVGDSRSGSSMIVRPRLVNDFCELFCNCGLRYSTIEETIDKQNACHALIRKAYRAS